MNPFKRFLREAFLSVVDLFRNNYTYHSGALTYHFLLSMAPLTIVLLNLLSFLPVVDIGEVEQTIDRLFPQYTNKVIHEILEVQKRSRETSLIALGLSYFFSVGFIKYVGRAFSFVSEGELGERRELFYWFFMPVFLLGIVLTISLSFFLSIYLKLVVPPAYSAVVDLSYAIPGTLVLLFIYRSFLKNPIGIGKLFLVSAYVSLLMFLSQLAFTWYIAHVFKGSLLYGSLSTIIVSLLWVNLLFLTLLYGARLIHRLGKDRA
ncbi:YihY/virulence factor BrkB family protein [Hydrogenivirga sp.]